MRVLAALALLPGCSFGLMAVPEVEDDGLFGVDPGDEPRSDQDDALTETAVDLDGKLYAIAPDAFTVTEPPGLDGLFDEVLDRDVLVFVESETSDEIVMDVTLAGTDGEQNPCEPVRAFPAGDWSENPVFDVGPGELTTSFGGHRASFRDLQMSGVFDEYAFTWTDGTLSAELDTRELAPALPEVDDLCELVEELRGSCEPCDDGADACFALRIEGIVAEQRDSVFDPSADGSGCAN
ncbi:MAG: hypothetical protein ACOZNI_02365 [Myxococcota bacterium]